MDIQFTWIDVNGSNNYELDSKVNIFRSEECKNIDKAYVFSLPIISIIEDETFIGKIVKPLKEL